MPRRSRRWGRKALVGVLATVAVPFAGMCAVDAASALPTRGMDVSSHPSGAVQPPMAVMAAPPSSTGPSVHSPLPTGTEVDTARGPRSTNAVTRSDSYREFSILVLVNGRPVAGFHVLRGVQGTAPTNVEQPRRQPREGSSAASSTSPTVTLSRGVSRDADFESWAASALGGKPAGMPLPRRDLVVETFDEAGDLSASYRVLNA
jgi:hypothetical protein